jgi:hypothetical protein
MFLQRLFKDVSPRTKFLLLVNFMILCVVSLEAIPALKPWGADLHNIHIFEHCSAGKSPYLINARVCGDLWNRPFYYPPFQFAFFAWTRPFSLQTSMIIWTAFLFVSWAVIFAVWTTKIARDASSGPRYEAVVFGVLLAVQFPFVFALERGNTDTVNVLFYTLAAFLFVRRRVWLAGMAAGVAAGFKLSPILAVVVMTGALLLALRKIGRWSWLLFCGGALTGFALTLVVFFSEAKLYLFNVLPKYSDTFTPRTTWGHSITTFVGPNHPNFARLLVVGLLGVWAWAGGRAVARGDAAMAFAGSLAVSTYAPRTSFDYNLISTYPLLLMLFLRAQRTNRWGLLAWGVFAIAGDRRLFDHPFSSLINPQLHLAVQLAFLVTAAVIVARGDESETAAPPPQSPQAA